jgi:hypothetical protein
MQRFAEAEQHIAGVDLAELEPLTVLLVWTWHSLWASCSSWPSRELERMA